MLRLQLNCTSTDTLSHYTTLILTHDVAAVYALPFLLMITYTGLETLAVMYMPWGIAANYARSDSFFEAVYPERAEVSPTGVAAPLVSIAPLRESDSRHWHGAAAIGRVSCREGV